MSKKSNPTLIGAFVVGAIVLAILGAVVFGSGKFFTPVDRYVAFFEGSVKGLDVGAPVNFRGVRIGNVSDVILDMDPQTLDTYIRVYMDVEQGKSVAGQSSAFRQKRVETLINKGLRSQLELQSLVTGKLSIAVDFHPDTPVKLVGRDTSVPEVPTIPTSTEVLKANLTDTLQKLSDMPIDKIGQNLNEILAGVNTLVDRVEKGRSVEEIQETFTETRETIEDLHAKIAPTLDNLNAAIDDIQILTEKVTTKVDPLTADFQDTTRTARDTMDAIRTAARMKEGEAGVLARDLHDTLDSARAALDRANSALASFELAAGKDSALLQELQNTLQELSASARAIRTMAQYLEQHPESVLHGKSSSGGSQP